VRPAAANVRRLISPIRFCQGCPWSSFYFGRDDEQLSATTIPMFSKILVATDGSPLSELAASAAVMLARGCGAELGAFSVAMPYSSCEATGGVA
jgi:hypothetical protein